MQIGISLESLKVGFSKILLNIEDYRDKNKINYSIHDTMMSGLACMFFQDPSLVQFQKRLEDEEQKNNLKSLFGVENIPKDSQMREIIDELNPQDYEAVFKEYFSRLQRGKHLKQYEFLNGYYICSIDGTQFFNSNNVNCSSCLTTEHKNGDITYSHKVLQAAIMHPDFSQVIPLMPEEIKKKDGLDKQDCEINAGKRLLPKIRKDHPQLNLIIVGDGLYSKQPFIETVLEKQMHYILIVKPKDHKYLMDWIETYDELNKVEVVDEKGRVHIYEWMNDVPLNSRDDSLQVNYVSYKIIDKGKVTYKSSWVTDIVIRKNNVAKVVEAGRCRWKIENECFNTLKNQGYHVEHNYGHGKKYLCFNFFLLTLVAFFMHQIAELTNGLYQSCRKKFGSKRHLWETLRSYIRLIIYESFEHLLDFALRPQDYKLPYPKRIG